MRRNILGILKLTAMSNGNPNLSKTFRCILDLKFKEYTVIFTVAFIGCSTGKEGFVVYSYIPQLKITFASAQ